MSLHRVNPVVPKSEALTTADINKIPRADGTGKINVSWMPYMSYTVSVTEPTSPLPMAIWNDTSIGQLKIYDGKTWRTFA